MRIGRATRVMNDAELLDLARNNELGAHSQLHSLLLVLADDEQRTEITGSRTSLETLANRTVRSFAYPYGAEGAFDDRTVQLVEEAGYGLACTGFPGAGVPSLPSVPAPAALPDGLGDDGVRRSGLAVVRRRPALGVEWISEHPSSSSSSTGRKPQPDPSSGSGKCGHGRCSWSPTGPGRTAPVKASSAGQLER